jgi:RHS repeat-associated protein
VTSTKLISDQRYEDDGLKLLRVDESIDADQDGEVESGETSWRTLQAATYGPGIVGNLLGKVVYTHTNNDATPDSQADYYYHYDHVGNVYLITDDEAEEVYRFSQDAFGNELDFGNYTGDSWATAAAAGIGEHQTGKWIDDFSGLYFFHARWYDSEVGRFLGRNPVPQVGGNIYSLSANSPVMISDPTGRWRCWGPGCTPPPDWDGTVDPICCDACAGAAGALAGVFTADNYTRILIRLAPRQFFLCSLV